MAQLVEPSLSTPEIRSLNPNIGKVLSPNCKLNRKDENKEEEAMNAPSFIKHQGSDTHVVVPAELSRLAPARGCIVGLAPRAVAEVLVAADELAAVHPGHLRLAVRVLENGENVHLICFKSLLEKQA